MKKILFCLMILIIGICLISASYAISQENNTIGSTLPQSESHTIQHNPQNMQANSMTNSSNYTENKMQHYKDLTKTNNNTYKEVTINGSKYISTPEGLCPIKKTHNGTEYFTTKEGKTYYIVELKLDSYMSLTTQPQLMDTPPVTSLQILKTIIAHHNKISIKQHIPTTASLWNQQEFQ